MSADHLAAEHASTGDEIEAAAAAADRAMVAACVQTFPDWPRPGLAARDISPLLANPPALRTAVRLLSERYLLRGRKIDVVVACEARGFLIGVPVALALDAAFVPIRKNFKKMKLPGEVVSIDVSHSAFASERLEIQRNAIRSGVSVLILDDVIGSGATMDAAARLVESLGGIIVGCASIAELSGLKGRAFLMERGRAVHVLLHDEPESK